MVELGHMNTELARWVTSDDARKALARAETFADPDSLAAAEAMRREWPAEQAAAALTQVSLRRRAVAKFGEAAGGMFFTPDGLEQATRASVAAWRAARFREAGVGDVVDVGCGIGSDARAFAAAGMGVTGVEADPVTAVFAEANVRGLGLGPGARVVVGLAEEVLGGRVETGDGHGDGSSGLVFLDSHVERTGQTNRPRDWQTNRPHGYDRQAMGVFVDPARRNGRGRSWRVDDLSPSWEFCCGLLEGRVGCVKAAPGLERGLVPEGVEACWVSDRGDLVELSLWSGWTPGARAAVLLPAGDRLDVDAGAAAGVGGVGAYVLEPDPAVIRSQGVDTLAGMIEGWRLAGGIAYLSGERAVDTAFGRWFEVLDVLPFDERALRAWARRERIGAVEIKVRGVGVDPAVLRRRLKLSGPESATLIVTPTVDGARALVVRRM